MMAMENSIQRFAVLQPRDAGALVSISPEAGEAGATKRELKPFGDDGLTFADVLDVINPLQHLPIISTLYRNLTGDTISPGPRIVGDTLFGGPIGAFVGIVNVISESETGRDVGENILAWIASEPQTPEYRTLADSLEPAADPVFSTTADATPWRSQLATTAAGGPEALYSQRPGSGFQGDNDEAALVLEEAFPDIADSTILPTPSPIDRSLVPDNGNAANLRQTRRLFGSDHNVASGAIGTQKPVPAKDSNPMSPLAEHTATQQADDPGAAGNSRAANAAEPGPGAMAANGGWFADTMLSALTKYQKAEALKGSPPEPIPDNGAVVVPSHPATGNDVRIGNG